MRRFGIDVDRFEKSGALHVIDCKDWYIIRGEFNISKTIGFWKKLYDEAVAKGFKGLRVTGDMAYFLDQGMVKELLKYEKALHKVLEFPMTAICAYDSNIVAKEDGEKLYFDLIKAHGTVIFAGPELGIVKSPNNSKLGLTFKERVNPPPDHAAQKPVISGFSLPDRRVVVSAQPSAV